MINVADEIKKAYENSTTQIDKITINGQDHRITNVEYYDDCYLDGNIFGTAIGRMLEFEIENTIELEKAEVKYSTGLLINGIEHWISLGNFIVESIDPNDTTGINKVVAMDYMLKANTPYESKLNYSSGKVTLLQVMEEACSNSGLILATKDFANCNFIVDSNQFSDNTLNRQVFQAVAQISGTFAKIKSDNKLYLITPKRKGLLVKDVHAMTVAELNALPVEKLSACDNEFNLKSYKELVVKRNTHPINLVSLGMSDIEGENVVSRDKDSISKDGENSLVINDNPFAYTEEKRKQLITALFECVKGFEYSAYEISGQSKPYLETGDEIVAIDRKGNLYYSFLFRFNFKSPKGLESEMSAPSITKATVAYQNVPNALDVAKRTEIIVDKQNKEIRSFVSDTYTTKAETATAKQEAINSANDNTNEKLKDYSTKVEMNSAITQKAESITSTVSKTYSTKTETSNAKQEAINTANASTDKKLEGYSTTEEMNSAITQKADEISTEVNKKVGEDELSTKIQQDYESVRIAWNKISEFIQFINAQLQIKDNSKKLLMALDKLGMHFYKSTGTELGDVGIQDTDVISFAVMNGQGSMAWGIKYTHDGTTDFYPVFSFNGKMVADGSGENGGYGFDGHFDFEAPVRLFEHPIYFNDENGGYIQGDSLGGVIINVPGIQNGLGFGVDDGTGNTLLYLNKDIFQIMTESIYITTLLGTELLEVAQNVEGGYSFDFKNNSIINVDNVPNTDNIDYISGSTGAGGYINFNIKNEGSVTLYKSTSDKNFKKNIKTTETKALDRIKKIKHREFDWKDNNEHQEIGYIAQEMQKIDSTFVHHTKFKIKDGEEKEDWQINTLSVLATATKAIQEQQETIESLQKQIQELKEGK